MRPPTSDKEALDIYTWVEATWRQAFEKFTQDDEYYEGDFSSRVAVPEGYHITVPSTLRAVVDEAVDNIMPQDFSVLYSPRGITKRAEQDADKIRLYCKALIKHWLRAGTDVNPIRDSAKNLFISGYGGVKFMFDQTLWPSYSDDSLKEAKEAGTLSKMNQRIKQARERNCPFVLQSLPPRCVVVDSSVGGRKLWAIERYEGNTEEVKRTYAKFNPDFAKIGMEGSRVVSVAEVWSADHFDHNGKYQLGQHWIIIDKKVEFSEDNSYGDLPYNFKFSGFGREDFKGNPASKAVGFYTNQVKSLGSAEVRAYSQFDAIRSQTAFPVGMVPDNYDPTGLDLTPGAMNSVPEQIFMNNERLFTKIPMPDAAHMNALNWIAGQIERTTTQQVLRGAALPGTDSAAQLSGYYGSAKLRLTSAQEAIEDVLSWACSMALRMIEEELEQETSIWVAEDTTKQYTIGPKNIQGHHVVTVRFQLSEEQMKERRLALAADFINKLGLSPYDGLVYAGWDNPSEVIDRSMAWKVMSDPLIIQALSKRKAQEWGLDVTALQAEGLQDQAMLAALAQLFAQMSAPPPPQGGPPMGEMPMGEMPMGDPSMQDPNAALAQQGMGPMPQQPGAPVQDPMLQSGAQMQALPQEML